MPTNNSVNASSSGLVRYNGSGTFDGVTTTNHNLLVGAASNGITSVAPSATSGVAVISQGASADPAFGTVVVAGGGTGNVAQDAYSLVCGGTTTTGAFQAVGPNSSSNAILMATGTSSLPTFTTTGTPYVTGISFDAGSNTLSNYSVGTFTPTLVGNTSAGTTTYTSRNGYYTRIGGLVQIQAGIAISAATGTGNLAFGAFPFTIKNQTNGSPPGPIQLTTSNTWPASTTAPVLVGLANTTTAWLYGLGNGVAGTPVQIANTSWSLNYELIYEV